MASMQRRMAEGNSRQARHQQSGADQRRGTQPVVPKRSVMSGAHSGARAPINQQHTQEQPDYRFIGGMNAARHGHDDQQRAQQEYYEFVEQPEEWQLCGHDAFVARHYAFGWRRRQFGLARQPALNLTRSLKYL